MNFQKIVKIVAGLLGILGVVFLLRIIGTGDEEIKMAAAVGDFGKVTPLISIAQLILVISIAATVIFSLLNLFGDSQKLKKALVSVGFLVVVVGLAFALSSSSCPIVSIDSSENSFKTYDINSSVVVFPLGVPPIMMRLSC